MPFSTPVMNDTTPGAAPPSGGGGGLGGFVRDSMIDLKRRREEPGLPGLQARLEQGGNFGSIFLKDSLVDTRRMGDFATQMGNRHTRNVANAGNELTRLRGASSSAVAQKFSGGAARGFAGNLDLAVRRGKARQGILSRGDAAIRNQQLKDRLTLAKQAGNRQGMIQGALSNAARLREGGQAHARQVASNVRDAQTGAIGSIIGGAARGFQDMFSGPSMDPTDVGTDMGTAAADSLINTDLGSFDISNIGTGLSNNGVMVG